MNLSTISLKLFSNRDGDSFRKSWRTIARFPKVLNVILQRLKYFTKEWKRKFTYGGLSKFRKVSKNRNANLDFGRQRQKPSTLEQYLNDGYSRFSEFTSLWSRNLRFVTVKGLVTTTNGTLDENLRRTIELNSI